MNLNEYFKTEKISFGEGLNIAYCANRIMDIYTKKIGEEADWNITAVHKIDIFSSGQNIYFFSNALNPCISIIAYRHLITSSFFGCDNDNP